MIVFDERGPGSIPGETHVGEIIRFLKTGSIPGETHVGEIIRFLKTGVPCGSNPRSPGSRARRSANCAEETLGDVRHNLR